MILKLEFEKDDDAFFGGDRAEEASCIIREVAESLSRGSESGDIRDLNGNRIGQYAMTEEAAEDAATAPLWQQARRDEIQRINDANEYDIGSIGNYDPDEK